MCDETDGSERDYEIIKLVGSLLSCKTTDL